MFTEENKFTVENLFTADSIFNVHSEESMFVVEIMFTLVLNVEKVEMITISSFSYCYNTLLVRI